MEWIKVSERLPTDQHDYLVFDGEECYVTFYLLKKRKWFCLGLPLLKSHHITHWRELPPTPPID